MEQYRNLLSLFLSCSLVNDVFQAIIIAAVIACICKRVGSKELSDLSTPMPSGDNFSNANSGQGE